MAGRSYIVRMGTALKKGDKSLDLIRLAYKTVGISFKDVETSRLDIVGEILGALHLSAQERYKKSYTQLKLSQEEQLVLLRRAWQLAT